MLYRFDIYLCKINYDGVTGILYYGDFLCMLTTQRKFTLHKINVNFPKVRVTVYIKFTQNFQKQCMPNFILCKFAAIQTSQHKGDYAVGG